MKSLRAVMLADFFISCHADIADCRRLFLGFEYFSAIYFSDLSILVRFISRI